MIYKPEPEWQQNSMNHNDTGMNGSEQNEPLNKPE